MPTYIEGDIPIGTVQSGDVVLRNVVIETALPYKPPAEGGFRSIPYPEYVPDGTERMVLLNSAGNSLMTADAGDGRAFLGQGWQLVGMFDAVTAERVADRLASQPVPDSRMMMAVKNQRRIFGMGAVATMLPLAKMNLLIQREVKLRQKVSRGEIAPPDPTAEAAAAKSISADAARSEVKAANLAQQISNTIAYPPAPTAASGQYVAHYMLIDPNVPVGVGSSMEAFFANLRDSSGRLVSAGSIDPSLLRKIYYPYPDYPPVVKGRTMGRRLLAIYVVRAGLDNPFVSAPLYRAQEWNASPALNQNYRVVSSTFGTDGLT